MKEYAIYKGDKLVIIGTAKELAKKLNIKIESVYYMSSPANKRKDKGNRMVAEVLD